MSVIFAELLQKELCSSTDVTKFIDCVWRILMDDDRSRALLARKIESTHPAVDVKNSASTPCAILDNGPTPEGVITGGSASCPPSDSLSHSDHDFPSAYANSSAQVCIDNDKPSDSRFRDGASRTGCQTSEEETPCYLSPLLISSSRRRPRTPDIEDEAVTYSNGRTKRRRTSEEEGGAKEDSSVDVSQLSPPPLQRRLPDPGKRRKETAPVFGIQKFLKIEESLRLKVFKHAELDGLQDAWKLVDAFRSQPIEQVPPIPSYSPVKRLKCSLYYVSEKKSSSLMVRAQIWRRFNMVQVIAEYRRQEKEKENKKRTESIVEDFKRELFPGESPAEAESSWDCFRREGDVLFEAVQRYGYGALVIPLQRVADGSLHGISRKRIDDFVDYIGRCKPGLEARIRNFSYVLPRLMTWGLPPDGLWIENMRYENLSVEGDDVFNRMFPLPPNVTGAELQLPGLGTEITPWPTQVVTGDSVPDVVT
ncbi:hypothetical protein VFPPC_12451 [Pochonia chlamydosporia 170]|uniref:Uncharacterized protein n=1 Tax=Pochonia chlamydosporia 170 TaxID=1380566 RepID=A0A179FVJ5_METCM|nr:hypothetical protein VFPPC_12451 [Pochonia chlamydosporia 170]OAQ69258.1 hypothetical protein VFPPC_12451 [Pochonia chlamydosporia 170]